MIPDEDIKYTPTPEEIREECAKIRESWPEQRLRRYQAIPWEVPTVHVVGENDA